MIKTSELSLARSPSKCTDRTTIQPVFFVLLSLLESLLHNNSIQIHSITGLGPVKCATQFAIASMCKIAIRTRLSKLGARAQCSMEIDITFAGKVWYDVGFPQLFFCVSDP